MTTPFRGSLNDVRTDESRTFAADGLFVAIGHDPNTALFRGKLALDDEGYITVAEPRTATSVPGVFAAGDVTDRTYRQARGYQVRKRWEEFRSKQDIDRYEKEFRDTFHRSR